MTKKRIPIAMFLWSMIACFASSSAAGETWNSARDFSSKYALDTWSYLVATGLDLDPNVYEQYDKFIIQNGVEAWFSSKYTDGTSPSISLIPNTPPQVAMMPGYSGVVSILAFSFPSAGTYSIEANFSTENGDADKYIRLDNETLWIDPAGTGEDPSFGYTRTFGSDFDSHTMYFIISGDPDSVADHLGIDVTVTRTSTSVRQIPEPSSGPLWAVGLLAVAGLTKRPRAHR